MKDIFPYDKDGNRFCEPMMYVLCRSVCVQWFHLSDERSQYYGKDFRKMYMICLGISSDISLNYSNGNDIPINWQNEQILMICHLFHNIQIKKNRARFPMHSCVYFISDSTQQHRTLGN